MKQLLVGYITSKENAMSRFGDLGSKNNRFIEILFHVGPHFGLQWVFSTSENIDLESNTINGTIFVNGQPEKNVVEIPRLVDNILLRTLNPTYNELKMLEDLKIL